MALVSYDSDEQSPPPQAARSLPQVQPVEANDNNDNEDDFDPTDAFGLARNTLQAGGSSSSTAREVVAGKSAPDVVLNVSCWLGSTQLYLWF